MSPELYSAVSIGILVVLLIIVMVVKYVRKKNSGEEIDVIKYLSEFSDKISVIAEQVILLCNMDQKPYENEEEFKKELIDNIIDNIKNSVEEIGISLKIIDMIDRDAFVGFLYNIIESDKSKLLSMVQIGENTQPESADSNIGITSEITTNTSDAKDNNRIIDNVYSNSKDDYGTTTNGNTF